jgi:carbon starvation protein
MVPFLFTIIACGAISGFHSLVSSGTSSKQLSKETDALPVGYGSMLMEAVLATLVLIAVAAGIGLKYKTDGVVLTGYNAWSAHYSSWMAVNKGLGAKLSAFVNGSANMIETMHIPGYIAVIVIGVFIASFAGTTLDTATRLQRYIIAEFFSNLKIKFMSGKYVATFLAVATAAVLTFATGASGAGALTLWPMFGAVNQLLAALGLLVITVYLKKKGPGYFLIAGIPCIFMLTMTIWAIILNEMSFIHKGNYMLAVVNGIILLLAIWMVIEVTAVFFGKTEKTVSDKVVAAE